MSENRIALKVLHSNSNPLRELDKSVLLSKSRCSGAVVREFVVKGTLQRAKCKLLELLDMSKDTGMIIASVWHELAVWL
jgi:hypothetical protein